jgi:hypothetical protein
LANFNLDNWTGDLEPFDFSEAKAKDERLSIKHQRNYDINMRLDLKIDKVYIIYHIFYIRSAVWQMAAGTL